MNGKFAYRMDIVVDFQGLMLMINVWVLGSYHSIIEYPLPNDTSNVHCHNKTKISTPTYFKCAF
jgi:hypothetical protein